MNWPTAVFSTLSILILSSVAFLVYVYRRESAREETIVTELTRLRETTARRPIEMIYLSPEQVQAAFDELAVRSPMRAAEPVESEQASAPVVIPTDPATNKKLN